MTKESLQLNVLISGGFAGAYEQLLPEFQRMSGIKVTPTRVRRKGSGPQTIAAQLGRGVIADVVILSREGLKAQAGEAHRGAQSPELCVLRSGDVDGLLHGRLGLAPEPIELRLKRTGADRLVPHTAACRVAAQAMTRSGTITVPFVSGERSRAQAKLSAPRPVPTIIGIAKPRS
jgi:hypothetical protein